MRKKLKLDVDSLTVDTFAPALRLGDHGTVVGHDVTEIATCGETCLNSCGGTCKYNTCNAPWYCPY